MIELFAVARRWLADRLTPSARSSHADPADMGTAMGLDAITSIEPAGDLRDRSGSQSDRFSPFQPRPPRRSVY